MHNQSNPGVIISWVFGIAVFAAGVLNIFWGNDPGFGVFLLLLSVVYFPPVNAILRKRTGIPVPGIVKIVLGVLIIWVVLGVGELFNKIELMMQNV